jgi:hypothetical protein
MLILIFVTSPYVLIATTFIAISRFSFSEFTAHYRFRYYEADFYKADFALPINRARFVSMLVEGAIDAKSAYRLPGSSTSRAR